MGLRQKSDGCWTAQRAHPQRYRLFDLPPCSGPIGGGPSHHSPTPSPKMGEFECWVILAARTQRNWGASQAHRRAGGRPGRRAWPCRCRTSGRCPRRSGRTGRPWTSGRRGRRRASRRRGRARRGGPSAGGSSRRSSGRGPSRRARSARPPDRRIEDSDRKRLRFPGFLFTMGCGHAIHGL